MNRQIRPFKWCQYTLACDKVVIGNLMGKFALQDSRCLELIMLRKKLNGHSSKWRTDKVAHVSEEPEKLFFQ